jgi:hypothetical protein
VAVYNEIQVGRFNRYLQKLLSMKGPASMNTLAPELMPILAMFSGTEDRYLQGWDRFGVGFQIGGIAAQTTNGRIRNPAGSNVIAVIEKLFVDDTNVGNDLFQLGVGKQAADLGSVVSTAGSRLDPRGRDSASCIVSGGNNALLGGFVIAAEEQDTSARGIEFIVTDIQELPLLPGDAYSIISSASAPNCRFTFWWRERLLEDSERA